MTKHAGTHEPTHARTPVVDVTGMSDRELLSAAIAHVGVGVRQFAKQLTRDPRTVWRWLAEPKAGEPAPTLPRAVRTRCLEILTGGPK